MRRLALLIFASLLVSSSSGFGASGDWNVFVNASAVNRITCVGDSLWCATRGGILLFEIGSSRFTQYLDGLGFMTTDVSAVTIDQGGSVWAAFVTSGVARIDRIGSQPGVTLYGATIDQLMSDSVTCIVSAGEDVYYGSTNGAAKFYDDIHTFEPVLTDSLRGIHVHDLLVEGDTLWVACERGVAVFERTAYRFVLSRIGSVTSLCNNGGVIHCAGKNGVQRFNGSAWVSMGLPEGNVPICIASGHDTLYCVTRSAAYRWTGSAWTNITANMKALFETAYRVRQTVDIVQNIAVDHRGTPWVSGIWVQANRGVYLNSYRNGAWSNEAPRQLSQNGVVALALVAGQGVWASTRYFGIDFRSNGGQWLAYTKSRTPTDPAGLSYWLNQLAILQDSQGYLWCNALDYDLDRVKVNDPLNSQDDEWAHYRLNEGTITSNRFVRAKEDPAGNRWFLSDDVKYDLGLWGINILSAQGAWLSVNPTVASEMASGSVFDVAFASGGRVYLALKGFGVQLWRTGGYDWANLSNLGDDTWETIIDPEDLSSEDDVYAIEQGPDGAVWLATASGVVRYRGGSIDSITVKTTIGTRGLVGAIAYDVEFDGRGNLWVATDQGLNRIDPDGMIAAYTTLDAWKSNLYPSSVISPLPSAACKALAYDRGENMLWIGTDNGLARLDVSAPIEVEIPLSQMILYPNPVYLSRGDSKLRITGISGRVSIQVYTIEGELVHEASDVAEGGQVWDLLTLNGYTAESGVYIVRVSNGHSSEVRKIGVVR